MNDPLPSFSDSNDSVAFAERETVREIESAIQLDDDDVEILENALANAASVIASEVAMANVTPIEGRRLVRLARDVNIRLAQAIEAGLVSFDVAELGFRLVGKSARITGEGYAPAPAEAWDSLVPGDLFANVLHLEALVLRLEIRMQGWPPVGAATAVRSSLAEYNRALSAWSAQVPATFRARFPLFVGRPRD